MSAERWSEARAAAARGLGPRSAAAGSVTTSSMSAADLMAVLLDGGFLRLDTQHLEPGERPPDLLQGPRVAALLRGAQGAGIIDDTELLTFRKLDSRLEGHPTPRIPPTDVASGSLGQGLPIAVGVALAGKRLDRLPYRVWCLCGDSEMAEGSMWEAFEHASFNELDNLTAIIDVNRLGQTRETMVGWDLDRYVQRAEAFGWHAIAIDGHDVDAIHAAYEGAVQTTGRPTVIVAKTKKGKGVRVVEDQPGKHGKPLDDPEEAIQELGGERDLSVSLAAPEDGGPHRFGVSGGELPSWDVGEQVATRQAYGEALTALGSMRGDVVALDGEVSNSTHSELFREAHEDRYFEMFIAEQQMAAAAVGIQVAAGPFASTFAAFFTRVRLHPHGGDLAREHPAVRLPCGHLDRRGRGRRWRSRTSRRSARSTARRCCTRPTPTRPRARGRGDGRPRRISFIRTLRGKTEVRTPADEDVAIGGSRIARR